jgi:hypothetical protein
MLNSMPCRTELSCAVLCYGVQSQARQQQIDYTQQSIAPNCTALLCTAVLCSSLLCYLFPSWSRVFCVFTATNCNTCPCPPFIPNEAGAELGQHVQIMFSPLVRHLFHCLLISWSCTPITLHHILLHPIPSNRIV